MERLMKFREVFVVDGLSLRDGCFGWSEEQYDVGF